MNKKELEKLRTLNATKTMINAMSEPGREKDWHGMHKYRYSVTARCQNLNGLLKISICTREDIEAGINTPKWDVYINYEGEEYITRERQSDGSYKWREACIDNLDRHYFYGRRDYDHYMYINPEGSKSIQALLETKGKGFEGVREWQHRCKKRREDEKIRKRTDSWNEEMKPIKEPPKGFESWWQHNAFDGDNYIYYESASAMEGYCTSCLDKVALKSRPKHNKKTRCPVCGRSVTLVSRAKKTNPIWTSYREVSCIQSYKDGLVQRDFDVRRVDKKNSVKVNESKFFIEETRRSLILKENCKVFLYGDYKRRGKVWFKSEHQVIERHRECMYPRNLKRLFKNRHTAYPIAVEHGYVAGGMRYFLIAEKEWPVIEKAYKAGLYALASDMVYSKWRLRDVLGDQANGELAKMLGIDKARMQRLKQMDGDMKHLEWLRYEKKIDTVLRDSDIKLLSKAEISPEELRRSKVSKRLSVEKICNYLDKQEQLRRGAGRTQSLERIWGDWNDYVDMMQKMKMDCSMELLLKPKDLAIAHNELVAKISMKKSKKEIDATKKKYKTAQALLESGELKKYEYTSGKYCIVAPSGIEDIYEEGMVLKHCIHTCGIYFQRINIRETYLLFLRKAEAPDKPWYTIEIEPGGNIRQKKSVLNEAYKDLEDAMSFLKEWQQWVMKNLSEEDKKLAEKSDKARKEGYKKLREEKKLIWHGRLQGTLLADALEDDFMGAV